VALEMSGERQRRERCGSKGSWQTVPDAWAGDRKTPRWRWRRLFLAAFGINLVVVAVLRDSRVIGCCPVWQRRH